MSTKTYPPSSLNTEHGMINLIPNRDSSISRVGYSNFIGLIWCLIRANFGCQKYRVKVNFNFTIPIRWL